MVTSIVIRGFGSASRRTGHDSDAGHCRTNRTLPGTAGQRGSPPGGNNSTPAQWWVSLWWLLWGPAQSLMWVHG